MATQSPTDLQLVIISLYAVSPSTQAKFGVGVGEFVAVDVGRGIDVLVELSVGVFVCIGV